MSIKASPQASLIDRVIPRVALGRGSCWVFSGALSNGYGVINVKGKLLYTHRVVYEWFYGPIASGLTIDHLCRMPSCCNPMHLEAVTIGENVRRATVKPFCKRGHEFTPENTYLRPDHTARRQCVACIRIRSAGLHKEKTVI